MNTAHISRTAALLVLACVTGSAPVTAQEADADRRPALSNAEIEALYAARQDSARMRFTDADVEFVTGMISHHAQALVMSELAPTHGASQPVLTLAARIINAQRDEIALMQRWLEDRGQRVPQVKIEGLNLTIDMAAPAGEAPADAHMADAGHNEHAGNEAHGGHGHDMPGMLTQEQLDELDAVFGTEFDQLFLKYMIQHHGGAVTMVDDLLRVDGAAQDGAVFKLASDIQVDQITEIERMKAMLAEMTDPYADH